MGTRNERCFTFVIVDTDAGISGIGDAFCNSIKLMHVLLLYLASQFNYQIAFLNLAQEPLGHRFYIQLVLRSMIRFYYQSQIFHRY